MKRSALISLCFALLTGAVRAQVTIEIRDPAKGEFLVTYELRATRAHSTEFAFPARTGLPSQDRPLEVVSITEKNTDQPFEHDVLAFLDEDGNPVEHRYVVNARFANPIPEGGHYVLEYKLLLTNPADSQQDADGQWVFRYRTSLDVFFVLPEGHAVVYSNYPVLVYGRAGRTILQQKAETTADGEPIHREVIFKTHEFNASK